MDERIIVSIPAEYSCGVRAEAQQWKVGIFTIECGLCFIERNYVLIPEHLSKK